ncbi:MAG: non-ribosomal peptide synthetase, partial [Burkholderiales bacterium]|nr:non-ribosomal peptide synthetase [Burkholderiales bacterium]
MNDSGQDAVLEGSRLSPQQKHVWLSQQANHDQPVLAQCALRLTGALDTQALQQALQKIIDRHEILRTGFHRRPGMKTAYQVIVEHAEPVLRTVDLTGRDASEQKSSFDALWREERERAFNLSETSPPRLTLLSLAQDEHVLLIAVPALCADPRTFHNLAREISGIYGWQGEQSEVELLQYADYAEWQHELLEADDEHAQTGKAYWQALTSLPNLRLPFENEPARQVFKPDFLDLDLATELVEGLEATARNEQTSASSAFTMLLACWRILLYRLTAQPDFPINVLCDGREYEELRDALGLFAKNLPVRCILTDRLSFTEVLRETERGLHAARE